MIIGMNTVKINKMPFIKWSGSKRKQAPYIVSKFPKEIDTYYEPFLGGGSVMHELLNQIALGNIKCNKIVCSDLNRDLINIWNLFLNDRQDLFDFYCKMHQALKERAEWKEGEDVTETHIRKCEKLYYEMRDKYNSMIDNNCYSKERSMIFYWLTRTCFNGLIRYNPKTNHFNASFHVGGRFGIRIEELASVFEAWGSVMDKVDIVFINDTYQNVIKDAKSGDLVYMDPPYENTGGMYFCNGFDTETFWNELRNMTSKGVQWLLSYDGITGEDDLTANVPNDIYKIHEYVNSGHSSFKKLKSKSIKEGIKNKDVVKDSLYLNYESV